MAPAAFYSEARKLNSLHPPRPACLNHIQFLSRSGSLPAKLAKINSYLPLFILTITMKHLRLFIFLSLSPFTFIVGQQLKSPDEFLGYPLGSQFTPHHSIVNYFREASVAKPALMKLEQYGKTNEGRPLLLAIISSEENISRLEEIRKNNLRLSGMLNDQPGNPDAPAVVWLSYNVHGNETSSSEVSMKTLYALLDPANGHTRELLKNMVVIIDPCLNPDGRERYVNWYTQIRGKLPDPQPNSREHNEPWPGGRFNHYYFDLNRDYAWQTQLESRLRLVEYNRWMPQVYSDYHEQGYNRPYYFAPAAEPYHEVITPWQREFQVVIGKNNAKYFDANGWLYFTKEVFDLFYPAYADTYSLLNGAVGMTFEQGGSTRAGSSVITGNGDTLTLVDRIAHHFTTGMSTLEMVSKYSARILKEYKAFFDSSRNAGVGEYKSFVITEVNTNKINALKRLLDDNGIDYGTTTTATLKGFNYFTGKEESFNAANSLVVSTYQAKGVLAKVLFEPSSKLIDSATYDVTAWSLPYVYGLQTYAIKEKIVTSAFPEPKQVEVPETSYGYLVSYQSFDDARFLAALIKAGIKVRYAENDFSFSGSKFKKGTMIILKKGNEGKIELLKAAARQFDVNVVAISSGFAETGADLGSDKVHFISRPNVALLTGKGVDASAAGEVWFLFDHQLNYPLSVINAEDIGSLNWKNLDVLILPNGQYKFLAEKDGDKDLKTWIRQGRKTDRYGECRGTDGCG
jgi:hypothetical protein